MTWHEARVAAQERLNAGAGLSLTAWRELVVRAVIDLVHAGVDDPGLEMVGALAAGVRPGASRSEDPLVGIFAAAGDHGLAAVDDQSVREARTAVLLATHVGLRSTVDEVSERLLVAAEQELLPYRSPTPQIEALRQWRLAVVSAADQLSPADAMRVAMRQHVLLQRAGDWLGRVAVPAGSAVERLENALSAAQEGWVTAVDAWGSLIVPGSREVSPAAAALNRAWTGITATMREETSPAQWLEAMVATDFAGVLSAAMTLRGPGESANLLTQVGVELEVVAEHLQGARFMDKPVVVQRDSDEARPAIPADSVHQADVAHSAPPVYRADTAHRGGVDVGSDSLAGNTPEARRQAVVARDAGVIARAALEGDAVACEMTRGVSAEQLTGLAEMGRRAEAQLLLWAKSVAVAAVREDLDRVPSQVREDAAQDVLAYVGSHLHRFDPDKGSLTTFAYTWAKYGFLAWQRQGLKSALRETAVDFAERERLQAETWQREMQSADEQVLASVSVETLRHRVAQLPRPERAVIVARFGLDGRGARTRAAVGDELGVSPSTVQRREASGLEMLRRMREQAPQPREVTMRDLAVQLQAAAPRQLLDQLRDNAARRRSLSPQRPVIDTIREMVLRQQRWKRHPPATKDRVKVVERGTEYER